MHDLFKGRTDEFMNFSNDFDRGLSISLQITC